MTNEEAIIIFRNTIAIEPDIKEAHRLAISALGKQIPKKVGKDGYGWNECTVCHNHGNNLLSNKFKWCPYCGQKLDWTEGTEA